MILPRLGYFDIVWNNLVSSQLERIERMQARAAKLVLLNDSSEIALRQLEWLSLSDRRKLHTAVFTFKCLHCTLPAFLVDYFSVVNHCYSTRRNGCNLVVPKIRTEVAKKSLYFTGAKEFIALPNELETKLKLN